MFAYIVLAPSILPKLPVVINEVAVIVPVTVPPLLASNELLARTNAEFAVELGVLAATAAVFAEGVWAGVECSFFVSTAYEPSLSSVSIVIIECPTAQMVSFSKLIFLTTPVAVDGILATSLSVNTSQRSSY